MPTFVEFDKLTGKLRRLLSSDERPPDAGPLSYQVLPPGMPDVTLSGTIEDIRAAVAAHLGPSPSQDAPSLGQDGPQAAFEASDGAGGRTER